MFFRHFLLDNLSLGNSFQKLLRRYLLFFLPFSKTTIFQSFELKGITQNPFLSFTHALKLSPSHAHTHTHSISHTLDSLSQIFHSLFQHNVSLSLTCGLAHNTSFIQTHKRLSLLQTHTQLLLQLKTIKNMYDLLC